MSSREFEMPFRSSGFFVFRTALLPFDAFLEWGEGLEAPACLDDPGRLVRALHSDRQRVRQRLSAIVIRPEVREALFLASADLNEALDRWLGNPDSKKAKRVERTLVRYFSRMCGRSTPFGLFAGCSVGSLGEQTHLGIDTQQVYQRHTRLDMDYLGTLIDALARDPTIQRALVYRPNSSLYRTAGRLRYAESRLKNKSRSYHLVAVDETDYLLGTLSRAEKGSSLPELAEALVNQENTLEEATAYVRELVESQLLVPELFPKATGPEPIHDLISQLRSHPTAQLAADRLKETQLALSAIDAEPLGIDIGRYKGIAKRLEDLPVKVELTKLFQVDMVKPASNAVIASAVLEEIARAVNLLHGLRPGPVEDEFSRFRESFKARYESREMPLVDVLDEESGIGFEAPKGPGAEASPLLEGLGFPHGRVDDRVSWGPFDSFLLKKLNEATRTGSQVINLEQEELERFRAKQPVPLPDSFSVVAKLVASSQEALACGDFKLLFSGLSGPSGANLLGRFCHGDPKLLSHVRGHLKAEESLHAGAIFAEIVHLPEGRAGNVILRPLLREYEIPFLGRSAVSEFRQIPVSDLMVSARGQTVTLRSRRLGNEIIPRLTSAHNYNLRGLGMYRFLCSLQHQGVTRALAWSWGTLEGTSYLPRVIVGRLVLSRARWRVDKKELKAAFDSQDAERYKQLQNWRHRHQVPRLVLLVDGDNKLPFDLDNVLSVETFVQLVRRREEFRLEEFYPGPELLCATGPEGRFVHELVIPFTRKPEPTAHTRRPKPKAGVPLRRSFSPGSEWLYAKLYTGSSGADQVLRQVVSPLVRQALGNGSADGWFFVRYGDPDWHLRVRIHGDPFRLSSEVLPQLQAALAPLLETGLLWRIQLDTYEREIERYGLGEAMLLAERIFQIDSEAVLDVLERFSGDAVADARWRLALRGMDQLLDDLGFDFDAKHSVIEGIRRSFFQEFHAEASFAHQLGDRLRRERASLERLLDRAKDESNPVAEGLAVLRHRSERLRPVIAELKQLAETGNLSVPLESIAASYIHMHANRMLRSAQKAHELVLYDFLSRLYQSRRARLLKTNTPEPVDIL